MHTFKNMKRRLQSVRRAVKKTSAQKETPLDKMNRELKELEIELGNCKGSHNILKFRSISNRIGKLKHSIANYVPVETENEKIARELKNISSLQNLHHKDLENKIYKSRASKVIPKTTRSMPIVKGRRNRMDRMDNKTSRYWCALNAHKRRFKISHSELGDNNVDVDRMDNPVYFCPKCNVDRIVDHEKAQAICPKCFKSVSFASHIFDVRDNEREETDGSKCQSLIHMERYMAQYEQNFPIAPEKLLEKLSIRFRKCHSHDPAIVQPSLVSVIMKGLDVPKSHKTAQDRICKELKGDSVPEFTLDQINRILNQRKMLQPGGNGQKQRKSANNHIYARQFGCANGIAASRLFVRAKTNSTHLKRTRMLEKKFMERKNITGNTDQQCWDMVPCT